MNAVTPAVVQHRLEYRRPHLYPKQFAAIFDLKRYSIIEATTKAGKTSGCIIWLAEQALAGKPGQNYWWIAPVSLQAEIAFRRMVRAVPRNMAVPRHNKTITLINGAVIWFKSGDKADSLYGDDVYAAVIDEASRFKEEAYHAVRSTLTATRGPIRIIGNVKGRRNWFYRLARKAEHGDDAMGYHKLTAYDAIDARVIAREEVEDARSNLPEAVFRELYLAEPSDDGGNPFGLTHIAAGVTPQLSAKPPRWWGWDFAKQRDYTVGIGLDDDGKVCRFERFQHVPWGETMNRVVALTGTTPALADSTGVGDPIVEGIQRKLGPTFQGYHFTSASKQKLMEGLAVAIQARQVGYPDGPIVQELEQFEFELTRTGVKYAAPEGYHDDCVCALALANMCRVSVPAGIVITHELLAQVQAMPRRNRY